MPDNQRVNFFFSFELADGELVLGRVVVSRLGTVRSVKIALFALSSFTGASSDGSRGMRCFSENFFEFNELKALSAIFMVGFWFCCFSKLFVV